MEMFLTEDITSPFSLGQVVCTIQLSVYNSEHIRVDNENTRQFSHIFLGEGE